MRFSLLACAPLAFLAIVGVTIAAGSREANAQALANDMTCDEAVAYFEEHGRIEARDGDQILPIFGGVAVSKQEDLQCDPSDSKIPTMLVTKDSPACTVSWHCD